MSERLRERIAQALTAVGCRDAEPLAAELVAAYSEAHRRYHDRDHLDDCLSLGEALAGLAERPAELLVALAFHDAVYDPRALDNEARSARWAAEALSEHGAKREVARRVEALVLNTRAHEAEAGDAALLSDIDLAVLGADAEGYGHFEAGVAEEFAWVDPEQYRAARRRVLARFLARPRIFRTEAMYARFEAKSRRNLARAIEALSSGQE